MSQTYTGRCFCGEVKFDATGEPALMGYCHCESCRQWTAAPVSAFVFDGRPKMKNVPSDAGGSGIQILE